MSSLYGWNFSHSPPSSIIRKEAPFRRAFHLASCSACIRARLRSWPDRGAGGLVVSASPGSTNLALGPALPLPWGLPWLVPCLACRVAISHVLSVAGEVVVPRSSGRGESWVVSGGRPTEGPAHSFLPPP